MVARPAARRGRAGGRRGDRRGAHRRPGAGDARARGRQPPRAAARRAGRGRAGRSSGCAPCRCPSCRWAGTPSTPVGRPAPWSSSPPGSACRPASTAPGAGWCSCTRCAAPGRGGSATTPTCGPSSRTPAGAGGGVVLVNPLHAETPLVPLNPSPYSPSSRRFRSPVWLRVEDVPEHAAASAQVREQVAALRPPTDPERVLRDPAWTAKLAALELLWPGHRADALAAFRAELGEPLEGFALFCALAERHGVPWQDWPEDLRHPDAPGVAAAREELAERVAFWCWVQLLVDEQLAAAAGRGRDRGRRRARPRRRRRRRRRGRLGAAGRAGHDHDGGGAARLVQPAGPGLGAPALAAGPAPGARLRAVPRDGPRRAPARRRGSGSTT